MDQPSTNENNAELILKAMASEAAETQCVSCGAVEMVIPLDELLDEVFLANYHCDECEAAGK